MPFNPVITPGVGNALQAQGGQYAGAALGRGIEQAGAAIAGGIEQYKQLNALGKAADTIYKNEPGFGAVVDPEVWKGMGSRDKVATLKAYTEKLAMDEFKERARLRDQQLKESEHRMEMDRYEAKQQAVAQANDGSVMRQVRALADPAASGAHGPPAPFTKQRLMQYGMQIDGAGTSPSFQNYLRQAPEEEESKTIGYTDIQNPDGSTSRVLNNGAVVGTFNKSKGTGELRAEQLQDVNGNPVAGKIVVGGRVLDLYGQADEYGSKQPLMLGGQPQGQQSAPPPPKPDMGGYKAGRQYVTSAGTYEYLGGDPNDQSNWRKVR